MLQRKIEAVLKAWKQQEDHNPLVIKGCRQCGKTFAVRHFAKQNYENVIYINFMENPEYCKIFSESLEIDYLVMLFSSKFQKRLVPKKTLLIFDEIQDCPEARTALKFFKLDGRFDVIATGSLLGVNGYGNMPKSVPVGFETIVEMRPMDFEEFLWANGVEPKLISYVKTALQKEKIIPEAIHLQFKQLLLKYIVVGGMPAVVQHFVDTKDMSVVLQMQRNIVNEYKDDMVKYAENKNKVLIKECFESIPKQLSKENKKFQYSVVKKNGTSATFLGILQWLQDAGIVVKCNNLHNLELPLMAQANEDVFKIYMGDTGLFVSMLDDGTQFDILQGNLLSYKGAIFENLIADFFSKMGRKLYYFRKDSGLEIDFVIRYQGQSTLVEVKSTQGNAKSVKTIIGQPEKYHIQSAIKLGDYNIGRNGNVLTLPLYCGFLLDEI
ncbi:MAG: ATP-binding protein [Phascolarctobacterium sp.]|nr:ATP-binding protein [Candidatus Phascolarctobacterium caballi]